MDYWLPVVGYAGFAPFVVGFVVDLILGTLWSEWRWWFFPPVAGLPGAFLFGGFVLMAVVTGSMGYFLFAGFTGLFYVLLPVAAAAGGVGLRRLLARSAKRPIDEIRTARK